MVGGRTEWKCKVGEEDLRIYKYKVNYNKPKVLNCNFLSNSYLVVFFFDKELFLQDDVAI
jgi:hypothetical protein